MLTVRTVSIANTGICEQVSHLAVYGPCQGHWRQTLLCMHQTESDPSLIVHKVDGEDR